MTTSHASKHQNDHVLTDWQTGIVISNWIVASFLFRLHDVTVSNEWKQGISKHFQYQILLLYKLMADPRWFYINLQWQGENRDYSLEINPIYVEIRALSEWNTNISIAHAQRYHIYFCNFIFTFTFIGLTCLLLYKTLMAGGVSWSPFQILLRLNRGGGGCPNFQPLLSLGLTLTHWVLKKNTCNREGLGVNSYL